MAAKKEKDASDEEMENTTNIDGLDDDDSDDEDIVDKEPEPEEIESNLKTGEGFSSIDSETSMLLKSRTIYSCPRCRQIYFQNKWQKDYITDIYTVRTEMAFCKKCLAKGLETFVGSIEVYDKYLVERKDEFSSFVKNVEAEMENREPFDKIIDITEKSDILYIFVNTTRLTVQIARAIRQEWHGAMQYEWFERNQFVRAKWFTQPQNREYFRKRIREAKEKRIGLFSFEED